MSRLISVSIVALIGLGLVLAGCGGAEKAESSRSAISEAKTMQTTQEKVDYLVGQAKAFYNSDDFQGAIDIAQYVLRYLDKDSSAAKDLLEKAKTQLQQHAKSVMDQAKSNFK